MCNWFKKLFSCHCHCGKCESCIKKEEKTSSTVSQPVVGSKPETAQPENVAKTQ